jgi:hypothetical protein
VLTLLGFQLIEAIDPQIGVDEHQHGSVAFMQGITTPAGSTGTVHSGCHGFKGTQCSETTAATVDVSAEVVPDKALTEVLSLTACCLAFCSSSSSIASVRLAME